MTRLSFGRSLWIFGLLLIFLMPRAIAAEADSGLLLRALSQMKTTRAWHPDVERLTAALEKAVRSYASLRDYKAIFHKREALDGALGDEERMVLKFEKPWKIYLEWLDAKKKGLQVVYEKGKNRGKLAVHVPGLLFSLTPVIFLDPNSPFVREGGASPYDIEDAGIGTFLTDFTKAVLRAAREDKLRTRWKESPMPEADVTFVDSRKDDIYFTYRVLVRFDAETGLPVEMELFDWQNRPVGFYAYRNLEVDVGPDDEAFKKRIDRRLYKVYR